MRLLLIGGSLLHVFGLMMASISSQYYQFLLAQGVCSAVGVAVVFLSAISAVTGWFHQRRGLAFGILSTGSSLGGVVFPIMLNRLIDTVGYGWAMRTSAFMIMALLIIANLTLRSRQAPSRRALPREHMWRPFREKPFVLLLVGLFLVPFGLYIPINYLPVASIGTGMSKELAQNLVAFYNAARYVKDPSREEGHRLTFLKSSRSLQLWLPFGQGGPIQRLHNSLLRLRHSHPGDVDPSSHRRSGHCILRAVWHLFGRIHLTYGCACCANIPSGGSRLPERSYLSRRLCWRPHHFADCWRYCTGTCGLGRIEDLRRHLHDRGNIIYFSGASRQSWVHWYGSVLIVLLH